MSHQPKVAQLRSSSLSVDFDFLFSACGAGRAGAGAAKEAARELSLEREEGGRNCQEYKAHEEGKGWGISPPQPSSRMKVPAHLGTSGSGKARDGGQCLPWGLRSCGVRLLGMSTDLPVRALTWWPAWRWQRWFTKPSWVPFPSLRPWWGACGRGTPGTSQTSGTRGPSCLGRLSPGEGRLFRGWDSCGRWDGS